MRAWTQIERAKQSALITKHRHEIVRKDPHASRLALARVRRDLSQVELGALAGVSADVVSRAERGIKTGKANRARISMALALPESEIFQL